jgi:hypothetical protein
MQGADYGIGKNINPKSPHSHLTTFVPLQITNMHSPQKKLFWMFTPHSKRKIYIKRKLNAGYKPGVILRLFTPRFRPRVSFSYRLAGQKYFFSVGDFFIKILSNLLRQENKYFHQDFV